MLPQRWFLLNYVPVTLQAFGGEFRRLMPSDLTQPGAYARTSLVIDGPQSTSGSKYARGKQRRLLEHLLSQDGCHHCGKS